jgi:integrase
MHTDKKFRVTLPQKNVPEYATPDDNQIKMLLCNASDTLRLCIYLSAIGTLRRGEICALKYKDVIRDKNIIYVHADMVQDKNGDWVYKPCPKNSSSVRHVELSSKIINMIDEGDPEDYIIGFTPGQITHRFIYLRNKLGLSCRFHDLRHYSATIRMYIGIPLKEIQSVGGWSSFETLEKSYLNILKSKSNEYTQKANDYFEENLLSDDAT